jgi:RHS repeat-associated protein
MYDHTQALLTTSNNNLFNGKELQHNEFGYNNGLEVYDYGARLYEPQIGRWSAVDRLADASNWQSPYSSMDNNPINYNDPTGMVAENHFNQDIGNLSSVGNAGETSYNDVATCPTCPGGSEWDEARNSKDNFTYDSAIDNIVKDGNEVTVTGEKETSVGEPGLGESLIPIWGSGRSAINNFQNGNPWAGIGYSVLAISDVFLLKAIATSIGKGVIKLAAKEGTQILTRAEMAAIKGAGSNFKILSGNVLKEAGIDAHALKMEFLGNKAPIAQWDLYKETVTNEILILKKGGIGVPIRTGIKIP